MIDFGKHLKNPCKFLSRKISDSKTLEDLDSALVSFQEAYRKKLLSPEQTALLVEAGKKKRAELSADEKNQKTPAQEALSKATYQGPGGVPRPNPHLMQNDEPELYRALMAFDPTHPDAFQNLEKLELWYMERERSEYGREWLKQAIQSKLQEITNFWASKDKNP